MTDKDNSESQTRPLIKLDGNPPYSVCYITQYSDIPRRLLDRAHVLIQAGWKVTIIAGPASPLHPWLDEESYPDVEIYRANATTAYQIFHAGTTKAEVETLLTNYPLYNWEALIPNFLQYLLEAWVRPHSLFVATDLGALPIADMAATRHGSKFMYESLQYIRADVLVGDAAPTYSAIERYFLKSADFITAGHADIGQQLERRFSIPTPSVIPWLPRMPEWRGKLDKQNRFRETLDIPEGKKIALYTGDLMLERRSVENLVAAAQSLPEDSVLVLMGPDRGGIEILTGFAEELGILNSKVFFHPPVGHFEYYSYIASADLGVIPWNNVDGSSECGTFDVAADFASMGIPMVIEEYSDGASWVCENKLGWSACFENPEDAAHVLSAVLGEDLHALRETLEKNVSEFRSAKIEAEIITAFSNILDCCPEKDTVAAKIKAAANELRFGDTEKSHADLQAALQEIEALPEVEKEPTIFTPCTPHPRPRNILVFVDCPTRHPNRIIIKEIVYCYRRYSYDNVFYVNMHYQNDFPRELLFRKFDLVIFHTIFLSARWGGEYFWRLANSQVVQIAKQMDAVKIVLPQDDFLDMKDVNEFINEFNINHVYTIEQESEWGVGFPLVDRSKVDFHKVLTVYIDDGTHARVNRLRKKLSDRPIDVGYRAWRAAPWLGKHGFLKGKLADVFNERVKGSGLYTDISVDDNATLYDDAWFQFMMQCRYFIGVEGGSSMIDFDGTIRRRTDEFVKENPQASFEEIEAACFPGIDGNFKFYCLSPRHIESILTHTGQALVEGYYDGVLQPDKHYIPIKYDLSNVDEVIEKMKDEKLRKEMCERSYEEIIGSGKYTYRNYVDFILKTSLGRGIE